MLSDIKVEEEVKWVNIFFGKILERMRGKAPERYCTFYREKIFSIIEYISYFRMKYKLQGVFW